ncbi:MAG: LapA family protein [Betaproteobacteria bacterium]|nr:LapA family protein [Betaproteobacteria bacterium]
MGFRSILLIVLFALLAAFAALNWAAFTASTSLTLGFTSVQAPLGLVMLALSALLALVFLGFAFYVRTSALLEGRRQMKELQAQRERADKAESSRITQLQQSLEAGLNRVAEQMSAHKNELLARMARLEQTQAQLITETANGLSAAVGELEDRMARRN